MRKDRESSRTGIDWGLYRRHQIDFHHDLDNRRREHTCHKFRETMRRAMEEKP